MGYSSIYGKWKSSIIKSEVPHRARRAVSQAVRGHSRRAPLRSPAADAPQSLWPARACAGAALPAARAGLAASTVFAADPYDSDGGRDDDGNEVQRVVLSRPAPRRGRRGLVEASGSANARGGARKSRYICALRDGRRQRQRRAERCLPISTLRSPPRRVGAGTLISPITTSPSRSTPAIRTSIVLLVTSARARILRRRSCSNTTAPNVQCGCQNRVRRSPGRYLAQRAVSAGGKY